MYLKFNIYTILHHSFYNLLYLYPYKSFEDFQQDFFILSQDFLNSNVKTCNNKQKEYKINNLQKIAKYINFKKIPPIIHIAGSVGKGSIVKYLESIFLSANYNTQTYTSPYIYNIYDSICFNKTNINKNTFNKYFQYIWKICQQNKIYLCYFTLKTIICLIAFSNNPADISIIETSLGGKYDSTNIIPYNLLTIITKIDLEHTNFFGTNIFDIAEEKTSIVKPNSHVIISPQTNHKITKFIEIQASKLQGKIIKTPFTPNHNNSISHINLQEDISMQLKSILNNIEMQKKYHGYHKENINTTISCISYLQKQFPQITNHNIIHGIINTEHSTRMQFLSTKEINKIFNCTNKFISNQQYYSKTIKYNKSYKHPQIILESAHNTQGLLHLKSYLNTQTIYHNIGIIFATSKNTSYYKKLSNLIPKNNNSTIKYINLCKITGYFGAFTSILNDIEIIQTKFKSQKIQIIPNIYRAINHLSTKNLDLIIITGSIYLLRDIYHILKTK